MFCFGIGVKDSPSFKISISSWVSGTFNKFEIFVDCSCLMVGSCDSRFFGNNNEFDGFHWLGVFHHILTSHQFHLNLVLPNAFRLIYQIFIPVIYISCFVSFNFTSIFCYH